MRVQNVFALDQNPDTFDDVATNDDDVQLIDTSPVDPYRQGTEIRNQHQYLAGAYKITSGERGHAIMQQPIGQGAWRPATITWDDVQRFDPVAFIVNQDSSLAPTTYVDDSTDVQQLCDGLLDPNAVIASTLPYGNVDADVRLCNGTLMDGNTSTVNGSADQVHTVSEFAPKGGNISFVDSYDGDVNAQRDISSSNVGSFFDAAYACYELFNREFWPSAAPEGIDIAIVEQLIRQLHRDDSYVQSWQRSATAGFQYASTIGTDSIAFGDMVHR